MSSKKKHPFTKEELAEAMAALDEEAKVIGGDWIAYCTACKAAVEVNDDPRIVQAAALTHARRRPDHQVIVGWEALGRGYAVGVEP